MYRTYKHMFGGRGSRGRQAGRQATKRLSPPELFALRQTHDASVCA